MYRREIQKEYQQPNELWEPNIWVPEEQFDIQKYVRWA